MDHPGKTRRSLLPASARTHVLARLLAQLRALALSLGLALGLAAALAASAAVAMAEAADTLSVERSVKAAFLYKFLAYVEYPQAQLEANAPYVVGVAGADDIIAELTRIAAGRNLNNHTVLVRAIHTGDALDGVHLLFIAATEGVRTPILLRAAQQAGALSVTETAGALQAGSVINFRLVDDHVRFEVSLEAAEKNNLKLSSRLLSVAYAVQKGGS